MEGIQVTKNIQSKITKQKPMTLLRPSATKSITPITKPAFESLIMDQYLRRIYTRWNLMSLYFLEDLHTEEPQSIIHQTSIFQPEIYFQIFADSTSVWPRRELGFQRLRNLPLLRAEDSTFSFGEKGRYRTGLSTTQGITQKRFLSALDSELQRIFKVELHPELHKQVLLSPPGKMLHKTLPSEQGSVFQHNFSPRYETSLRQDFSAENSNFENYFFTEDNPISKDYFSEDKRIFKSLSSVSRPSYARGLTPLQARLLAKSYFNTNLLYSSQPRFLPAPYAASSGYGGFFPIPTTAEQAAIPQKTFFKDYSPVIHRTQSFDNQLLPNEQSIVQKYLSTYEFRPEKFFSVYNTLIGKGLKPLWVKALADNYYSTLLDRTQTRFRQALNSVLNSNTDASVLERLVQGKFASSEYVGTHLKSSTSEGRAVSSKKFASKHEPVLNQILSSKHDTALDKTLSAEHEIELNKTLSAEHETILNKTLSFEHELASQQYLYLEELLKVKEPSTSTLFLKNFIPIQVIRPLMPALAFPTGNILGKQLPVLQRNFLFSEYSPLLYKPFSPWQESSYDNSLPSEDRPMFPKALSSVGEMIFSESLSFLHQPMLYQNLVEHEPALLRNFLSHYYLKLNNFNSVYSSLLSKSSTPILLRLLTAGLQPGATRASARLISRYQSLGKIDLPLGIGNFATESILNKQNISDKGAIPWGKMEFLSTEGNEEASFEEKIFIKNIYSDFIEALHKNLQNAYNLGKIQRITPTISLDTHSIEQAFSNVFNNPVLNNIVRPMSQVIEYRDDKQSESQQRGRSAQYSIRDFVDNIILRKWKELNLTEWSKSSILSRLDLSSMASPASLGFKGSQAVLGFKESQLLPLVQQFSSTNRQGQINQGIMNAYQGRLQVPGFPGQELLLREPLFSASHGLGEGSIVPAVPKSFTSLVLKPLAGRKLTANEIGRTGRGPFSRNINLIMSEPTTRSAAQTVNDEPTFRKTALTVMDPALRDTTYADIEPTVGNAAYSSADPIKGSMAMASIEPIINNTHGTPTLKSDPIIRNVLQNNWINYTLLVNNPLASTGKYSGKSNYPAPLRSPRWSTLKIHGSLKFELLKKIYHQGEAIEGPDFGIKIPNDYQVKRMLPSLIHLESVISKTEQGDPYSSSAREASSRRALSSPAFRTTLYRTGTQLVKGLLDNVYKTLTQNHMEKYLIAKESFEKRVANHPLLQLIVRSESGAPRGGVEKYPVNNLVNNLLNNYSTFKSELEKISTLFTISELTSPKDSASRGGYPRGFKSGMDLTNLLWVSNSSLKEASLSNYPALKGIFESEIDMGPLGSGIKSWLFHKEELQERPRFEGDLHREGQDLGLGLRQSLRQIFERQKEIRIAREFQTVAKSEQSIAILERHLSAELDLLDAPGSRDEGVHRSFTINRGSAILKRGTGTALKEVTLNLGNKVSFRSREGDGVDMIILAPPVIAQGYDSKYAQNLPPINYREPEANAHPPKTSEPIVKSLNTPVDLSPVLMKQSVNNLDTLNSSELNRLVDKVYSQLENRLKKERRRFGF